MREAFYLFVRRYRDPYKKDKRTQFANRVDKDQSFPKQAQDYHEIADYLELSGNYANLLDIFDKLYADYIEQEH